MKTGMVKIDDELTLHYQESGHGNQTILLVPGWTMSGDVFQNQIDAFENAEGYRFITFDPRSHGRSTKTKGGHYYEQHGKDLHKFIEAMSLDKIILGGWSFGCLATLSYVNQFGSDRLAGFIMLDGPPRASGNDNETEWVTYRYDDQDQSQLLFTCGRLKDPEKTNREFARWMLEEASESAINWVLNITRQTPDEVAALLNATGVFLDYESDLMDLDGKIPLCYIMREDQFSTVNNWLLKHTPSAEIHAFGEHLMFWERPQQFNQVLIAFSDRVFN
jgi:non-heme chloroperoxidase